MKTNKNIFVIVYLSLALIIFLIDVIFKVFNYTIRKYLFYLAFSVFFIYVIASVRQKRK